MTEHSPGHQGAAEGTTEPRDQIKRPMRIKRMGRLVTSVRITNLKDPEATLRCDALIDTGSTYMTLPMAWKDRLAELDLIEEVELGLANQAAVKGELRGPVKIQLEGFRTVYGEVLFVEMEPQEDGFYEPLVGYTLIELSHAAIDMVGHRLVHVKRMDLK